MQKKRITAMLTALVLAVSCLTGCGEAKKQESSKAQESLKAKEESTSQVVESSEEQKELEPVTLSFWVPKKESEDSALIVNEINKYLEKVLPNTTIEIRWEPLATWAEKWSKSMAAQETIDVAWFGYTNDFETEVNMGSFYPIEDLLNEYGKGIIDALGEEILDRHRSAADGKMYFVPAWQGMVGDRKNILLPHENVALLGEAWAKEFQDALFEHWEKPYWDEAKKELTGYMEQYYEASKQAGMLGLGCNVIGWNPAWVVQSPTSQEFAESEIDVTLVGDTLYLEASSSDTSKYNNTIRTLRDWYEKGYIRSDVASVEEKETAYKKETIGNNYIDRVHNGVTDDSGIIASESAGYEIDAFFVSPYNWLVNGFSTGMVIPATAANPERAMMFMNLLYADAELYQLLIYGIEGRNYTIYDNGTISYPENKTYSGPANWMFGTCMNSFQTNPNRLDYYSNLKAMEKDALVRPLEGFAFDVSDVSVEIANIKTVKAEFSNASVVSAVDFEKAVKNRAEKMRASGMDIIINELYDQLKPFAEAKGWKVEIRGY